MNDLIPLKQELQIDKTCAQVRKKIKELVASGVMTKTKFSRALGESVPTLDKFLKADGIMGRAGSNVYPKAWEWFKRREIAGLELPRGKPESGKSRKTGSKTGAKGNVSGSSSTA